MFDRIQRIGPIIGSNNLIINGDLVANGDILATIATQRVCASLRYMALLVVLIWRTSVLPTNC